MSNFGHVLMAVGLALLVFPVARAMGSAGYVLLGLALVVVGAAFSLSSDSAGEVNPENCPACGSLNDPDADACGYCGETL